MFGKIKEFFAGQEALETTLEKDKSGSATDRDLHIAAAVLLVEMASSDQEIAPQEGQAVVAAMSQEFGIGQSEVPELVEIAIASRQEKGRIDEFVKCINDNFNETQRQRVLAMLWKVIIADGTIDKYEQRLATQMKFRFKLSDEQAAEARKMAEGGEL